MKSVCIFCGSSPGRLPEFGQAARELGAILAQQKITLVYGGASVGLMGIMADAALEAGGEVIGVIPEALFGKEVAHAGLTKLHRVASMHERKTLMYELSDAFVALPGGIGTMEEFFEILTWAQLGLHSKPCGILNVAGYYDNLVQWLDRSVSEGFVRERHKELMIVAEGPGALLQRLKAYHGRRGKKWIGEEEI